MKTTPLSPAATQEASQPRAARQRLWRLTLGELRFTAKYGILALYGLLTVIYLLLLSVTAPQARPMAGGVTIFTDPAAMGLFFMGAMVLLEKSQQVNCALAVSPVRVEEYIAAKVVALMLLGLAAALVVGAYAELNLVGVLLSVGLSSVLFTLLGIIIASLSDSLNRFLLLTIPVEIVVFIPALFYWFGGITSPWWVLHPGVATLVLLSGNTALWLPAVLVLLVWDALVFMLCRRAVAAYFSKLGGGRL